MLQGITDNAGTIIVSLVLIALVTGIILQLRRDKKQGKSSCGGACGGCSYRDICGGCRARAAYYHNGDYMAEDTYCAYGLGL